MLTIIPIEFDSIQYKFYEKVFPSFDVCSNS